MDDVYKNNGSFHSVYGYWYLEGPQAEGVYGNAAYDLGARQAIDAYNCWESNGYSDGLTVFADAEWNQGWYPPPYSCWCVNSTQWQSNVNVISGFVGEMHYLTGTGDGAGIYVALSFLNEYMPGQTWPNGFFRYWGTGGCPQSGGQPSGLQSTGWYQSAMVGWHNENEAGQCLAGGQGVSVWQYYIGYSGYYQDYDLTPQQNTYECAGNYQNYYFCGGVFLYGWGDGTI